MKTTTVTPVGTLVLQFPAGQEIEAIENDGLTYYPAMKSSGGGKSAAPDETDDEPDEKVTPKKKGRGRGAAAEEDDEDEKPVKKGRGAAASGGGKADKAVKAVFTKLEGGEIEDEGEAVDEIMEVSGAPASAKKAITKIVAKFMADSDNEAGDMAAEVMELVDGGGDDDDEEEDEKPKSRRGAAKEEPVKKGRGAAKEEPKAKLKTVKDVSTLEVGDVCDVLLATDENEEGDWYEKCKVTKVTRGVPTFTFPDKDVLKYDEDTMLEIKLHA